MTLTIEKIGSQKPWVARITGTDPQYGLAREFVTGIADYSRANRPRTRGVYLSFDLADGIYEVKGGASWGTAGKRSFIRVSGDSHDEIQMDDVLNSLRSPA